MFCQVIIHKAFWHLPFNVLAKASLFLSFSLRLFEIPALSDNSKVSRMNFTILLLLYVLLFGIPAVAFGKFFKRQVLLAYAYFGFLFVFSQVLYVIYTFPVGTGLTISGGDIAYSSLLLITLFIVIISQDMAIFRNLVLMQVALGLFLCLLNVLIVATLGSPGVSNAFAIGSALFVSVIPATFLNTGLYIIEIFLLFFFVERIKLVIRPLAGKVLASACMYIGIQCLDGFLYPLVASLLNPETLADVLGETLGDLVLGLLFTPFIVLFILLEKANFRKYAANPFALGRLLFPSKTEPGKETGTGRGGNRRPASVAPLLPVVQEGPQRRGLLGPARELHQGQPLLDGPGCPVPRLHGPEPLAHLELFRRSNRARRVSLGAGEAARTATRVSPETDGHVLRQLFPAYLGRV